jgi:hypothetical protein
MQISSTQRALFHKCKEDGYEEKYVDGGGDHAAHDGAAIGFITSEPMPLSHRMGVKLARRAVTVLNFGRNR